MKISHAAPLLVAFCCLTLGATTLERSTGAEAIAKDRIAAHLAHLASPPLEGRDSPSRGLALAAQYVADQFAQYGLDYATDSQQAFDSFRTAYRPWTPRNGEQEAETEAGAGGSSAERKGTYFRPFTRPFVSPVPGGCELKATDDDELQFVYGVDFVPVQGADGAADGELVFGGFGISAKKEKYDDFKGLKVKDKVVLIVEGEPNHKRKFKGPEVTDVASLWKKLDGLRGEGVAGVLVVRRGNGAKKDEPFGPAFRFTYAEFAGARGREIPPRKLPPTLILSEAAASKLLGTDVAVLAQKMDRSARPAKWKGSRTVSFKAKTQLKDAALDNVVGIVHGTDPALKDEFVIVGAHYDHIGAGSRGRVGLGADDNASGTSALLEVARTIAEAELRRSVLFVAFSAEEDGLLGSKALCRNLPFDKQKIVCMVNLDMIGRGDSKEVVVLGLEHNPKLEKVIDRAKKASKTGIRKVTDCRDDSLFQRSDHHSFHSMLGVPVLFFFENYPVEKNPDYHTWRDTVDTVDAQKITNTAKLVHNTVIILANDDERPPKPRF